MVIITTIEIALMVFVHRLAHYTQLNTSIALSVQIQTSAIRISIIITNMAATTTADTGTRHEAKLVEVFSISLN